VSDDFPSTIKALRGYALRLDNGSVMSFGDLVDALETPIDRADPVVRQDATPDFPGEPSPISGTPAHANDEEKRRARQGHRAR
jgi:hypothetical protein